MKRSWSIRGFTIGVYVRVLIKVKSGLRKLFIWWIRVRERRVVWIPLKGDGMLQRCIHERKIYSTENRSPCRVWEALNNCLFEAVKWWERKSCREHETWWIDEELYELIHQRYEAFISYIGKQRPSIEKVIGMVCENSEGS